MRRHTEAKDRSSLAAHSCTSARSSGRRRIGIGLVLTTPLGERRGGFVADVMGGMLVERKIAQSANHCEINLACQYVREKNYSDIGARLREERDRLELSQDAVAEHVGTSRRTQLAWEKGDQFPNAEVLRRASELGIDVLYVVTGQRSTPIESALTREARELLANFDAADAQGRAVIVSTANFAAQAVGKARAPSGN